MGNPKIPGYKCLLPGCRIWKIPWVTYTDKVMHLFPGISNILEGSFPSYPGRKVNK